MKLTRDSRSEGKTAGRTYRAEDGFDDICAGGVRDVHGVELPLQGSVGGGVAAGAAGIGAEGERLVEHHRRPW